jgi:hypothetical protein
MPSTSAHALELHVVLNQPKTTSSKTYSAGHLAGMTPQNSVKPLPTNTAVSTYKAPERTAEESSPQIPDSPDPVLLRVTDPKEVAKRIEELEIEKGHKLVHFLRHGTAWSKYKPLSTQF